MKNFKLVKFTYRVTCSVLFVCGVSISALATAAGPNPYYYYVAVSCSVAMDTYRAALANWINCASSDSYCVDVTAFAQQACRNAESVCRGISARNLNCGSIGF